MRRKLLLLSLITVFLGLGTVHVQAGPKEDPAAKIAIQKENEMG
jgi:hypothetical protein